MDIPYVEEVFNVSSYHLLECIGFDTDISDGVVKLRVANILGEIVRLCKCTKTPLKYVHKNSKYGHLVAIPAYDNQDFFQDLQKTRSGLTKFLSICNVERRKIGWPWYNKYQSICLRNMKMKQFLPLLNVGFLSALT